MKRKKFKPRNFEKYTNNLTITFKNGFVHEVINHGRFGKQNRKVDPLDIQFIWDMKQYVKTQKVPLSEMNQWIYWCNPNPSVALIDQSTMVIMNIKL